MSTKKLQILGNLITTDMTLTELGVAADSKAVGDAINLINENKADKSLLSSYATTEYVDEMLGDIELILNNI